MAAIELFSTYLYNDSDLRSYYRLEADSTDAKGLNTGTDANMTYGAGKFNNGAIFNGTTGVTTIGTSKFNHANLSIVFWLVAKGTDKTDYIIARSPDADQWANLGIGFESSRMFVVSGGTGQTVQTYAQATNGDHMAFCWQSTSCKVYKNGTLLTTITTTSEPNNNITNTLAFGRAGAYSNYYFDGKIDDLAFFSKQLSAIEVDDIYNGTTNGEAKGGFYYISS